MDRNPPPLRVSCTFDSQPRKFKVTQQISSLLWWFHKSRHYILSDEAVKSYWCQIWQVYNVDIDAHKIAINSQIICAISWIAWTIIIRCVYCRMYRTYSIYDRVSHQYSFYDPFIAHEFQLQPKWLRYLLGNNVLGFIFVHHHRTMRGLTETYPNRSFLNSTLSINGRSYFTTFKNDLNT